MNNHSTRKSYAAYRLALISVTLTVTPCFEIYLTVIPQKIYRTLHNTCLRHMNQKS